MAAVSLLMAARAGAQTAANVLLVVNDATPTGGQIARRYAQKRSLPASNICHVAASIEDAIPRAEYARTIEDPIWRCLSRIGGQDRILYLVLAKGIPLRIQGSGDRNGTVSSIDSELTLLYRRQSGRNVALEGFVRNPYFGGSQSPEQWKPFTHDQSDLYLVTRLDGYTLDDVLGLIDRGAAPRRDGRIILDGRAGDADDLGNRWLHEAAERLKAVELGERVTLDETAEVITRQSPVLGYYSWGTNDKAIRIRHFGMGFVPGAIAGMYVSTDGRTMKEPPPSWTPGDWGDRKTYFGGSPQSLAGDMIRDGITAVAAHVSEPYLDATIRPDVLFPAYARGMNVAEAFYLAMPYLSWQTIVIGDPLCAPFREHPLSDAELNPGIDVTTELPARFSTRRLSAIDARLKLEARQAYARYESRSARGDLAGARQALEAAIAAEPKFTPARLALAGTYASDADVDQAIAQYRAILNYLPDDALTLNNLAYRLAVGKKAPKDALPLAQKAVQISRNDPNVADTLAWILHLLGRDAEALPSIASARATAPANADVHWHFVVILAARKDTARPRQELEAFLRQSPASASRPDVQELRRKLGPAR
jgi:uncharacterized protein (TIGR03790 family)